MSCVPSLRRQTVVIGEPHDVPSTPSCLISIRSVQYAGTVFSFWLFSIIVLITRWHPASYLLQFPLFGIAPLRLPLCCTFGVVECRTIQGVMSAPLRTGVATSESRNGRRVTTEYCLGWRNAIMFRSWIAIYYLVTHKMRFPGHDHQSLDNLKSCSWYLRVWPVYAEVSLTNDLY